jgi:peptidoglycan/LPS O-acetylase OafA/YrhL
VEVAGRSRLLALDGLRGLAALAVLAFHCWLYARPSPSMDVTSATGHVWIEGRLGLVLFFVLSGFLLYGPWLRAARHRGSSPDLRRYLVRRAARIVPAYYLAVAGSVALLWDSAGTPGVRLPPAGTLPLFAVFAQNLDPSSVMTLDPPTWTVALEVAFYLVLPGLGWAALRAGPSRSRQALVPLSLIAIGLVWNACLAASGALFPLDKLLPAVLPYFGAGMLAAVLLDGHSVVDRRRLMLAGIGAVLLDVALQSGAVPGPAGNLLAGTVGDLPAAAGFAAITAAAATCDRGALTWRPLVAAGTISYGLYLWNVPLLLTLRAAGILPLSALAALPLVLAVTIAVATVSWLGVERPIIRWTQRMGAARSAAGTRSRLALAAARP